MGDEGTRSIAAPGQYTFVMEGLALTADSNPHIFKYYHDPTGELYGVPVNLEDVDDAEFDND